MWRTMVLLTLAQSCHATQIGIVRVSAGGDVHLYVAEKLAEGSSVHFQHPDGRGGPRCCVVRSWRWFEPTALTESALESLSGEPLLHYRSVRSLRRADKSPFMGAAVFGRALTVEQRADGSFRVSRGGRSSTVRSCTSREGLHVIGERGATSFADLYVAFGYTIDKPSCTP